MTTIVNSLLRNALPRVTDVAGSTTPGHSGWPNLLRTELRKVGERGLSRQEIANALGCHATHGGEFDSRSIDATISYLTDLGLAEKRGGRWYEVTARSVFRRACA